MHDIWLLLSKRVLYSIRYGSVITGAIRSKVSSRKEKRGDTKGSVEKGKRQRGSFSFQGGMQVSLQWHTFLSDDS